METNHTLYISTSAGLHALIPAKTKLPASFSETFTFSEYNQSEVGIALYFGSAPEVSACRSLGIFPLPISRAPDGTAKLQVTFIVDENKNLTMKSYDWTNKEQHEFIAGVID